MAATLDKMLINTTFSSNLSWMLRAAALCGIMLISGCAENSRKITPEKEYFHADNDIAMTVRSVADAINLKEPLDSAEYNFEGILTDGQGAPLYIDVQGSPGVWEIDVLNAQTAVIRNLYLGDLLPDQLLEYLRGQITMEELPAAAVSAVEADPEMDPEVRIFNFGEGFLRFESRNAIAANGLEGPLVSILLSSSDPRL